MSQLNDLPQDVNFDAPLALAELAQVVGASNVLSDAATRERYARSTAARPSPKLRAVSTATGSASRTP